MTFYEKYKALNIDLECAGFDEKGDKIPYFCTPLAADILGIAGVDGIHFCTAPECGGTVFAVSPMNTGEDCVHAVAESFEDFLRLLMACGDTAAIEQAWQWDEKVFYNFLQENRPSEKAEAAFEKLKKALSAEPMERPYEYMTKLQGGFDYSRLRFGEEYSELMEQTNAETAEHEWAVYYDNGYCAHGGKGRPGEEIRVDKTFKWGDELWYIPAIYACEKGIVVDCCVEVNSERLKAFTDKYGEMENGSASISYVEREQLENENPLNMDFKSELTVGGVKLKSKTRYGLNWLPYISDEYGIDYESEKVLEHYSLDKCKAWSLHRINYPYEHDTASKMESAELKLTAEPTSFYCNKLNNLQKGDEKELTDPYGGGKYTLTVCQVERDRIDTSCLPCDGMEYPGCFTRITYTVEPQLTRGKFSLRDVSQSDSPLVKKSAEDEKIQPDGARQTAVIGGSDGPVALIVSTPEKTDNAFYAISSLRFNHPESVVWQPVFREKTKEDISVKLI